MCKKTTRKLKLSNPILCNQSIWFTSRWSSTQSLPSEVSAKKHFWKEEEFFGHHGSFCQDIHSSIYHYWCQQILGSHHSDPIRNEFGLLMQFWIGNLGLKIDWCKIQDILFKMSWNKSSNKTRMEFENRNRLTDCKIFALDFFGMLFSPLLEIVHILEINEHISRQ